MVKIKELEEYFGKSYKDILEDDDILEITNDIDILWEDYCKWEMDFTCDEENSKRYLESIKKDFYKWVENCSGSDLLDYDISTFQRHFKLENGKYCYLNNMI
jgi:hypothetical protein